MSERDEGAADDTPESDNQADRDRRRERQRQREQRRDSRRPPRSLQVAVAVGLGLVLVSIAALGVVVYLDGAAPAGPDVPQADVQFSYDEDTGTLAIDHVDGPAYTTENTARLYVAVNGTDRGDVGLPFGPGDRHVVEDVPVGQEVAVVWVADENNELAVGSTVAGDGE